MKKSFIHAAFIASCLQAFSAGAVSMTQQAKEMAQKDYRSAMARIASVNEADMLECAKRRGPAAKACEIQVNGNRAAAEDQAKLARERAGAEPPVSDAERKQAARNGARVARISYGMDKARIAAQDKQAHIQCNALTGEARNTCNAEVSLRTDEANREAKSNYDRSVARAKGISAQ
ncbi:hypothetical protein [Noviherbaspirillum soli]|uniref:hypothetical protein n=1 Tax=Noviherbaspirillum soli TaxID=1064518 RepID=UPI00188BE011|nr:hypothetical protein [Noviherbaspirillum soli]